MASFYQLSTLIVLSVGFIQLGNGDKLDEILARNKNICGQSLSLNQSIESRIVGGSDAEQFQFPWQISLRRYSPKLKRWYHTCGGAIIDSEWILTAAHCTMRNATPDVLMVRVGEYDYNKTEGYERDINVSMVVTHTGFNMQTIDNDINLLKLATPIDFNDTDSKLVPICVGKEFWVDKISKRSLKDKQMDNSTEEATENATTNSNSTGSHFVTDKLCVSTGWGRLAWEGAFPNVLKQVRIDLVDFDHCLNVYKDIVNVTDSMLCSGREGKGTCGGDSGGCLQCSSTAVDGNKEQRWSLYGLTSWAVGCAENKYPSVAARVVKFRDWIAEKIIEHR